MQSCSIRGCQSYKSIQWKPVAYFKFPFNNNELMNSWLSQIDQKNFSPTIQDQICSTHFLIEDIEPSSIGRYPILKPDAVPSVFPDEERKINEPIVTIKEKKTSEITEIKNIIQSPKFETILIPDYSNNKQIPILPKPTNFPSNLMQISPGKLLTSSIQLQTPSILPVQTTTTTTTTNPVQIQRIQFPSQLVKVQTSPILNKLTPIQPKLSPIVAKKSTSSSKQISKKSSTTNGKIMATKQISQLQEILENKKNLQTKSNLNQQQKNDTTTTTTTTITATKSNSPSVDARRPILKISINKLNDEPVGKKEEAKKVIKQKAEEVLVKSLNKSVIFRLNPSGEIVVETIENKKKSTPKSKTKPKLIKTNSTLDTISSQVTSPIVEREKSTRKSLDPKLTNLKTLYNKAQEDCEKLSKKLATLKKRHQEEQEQILKLQGLMTMPKKIETTFNDDSKIKNSISTKKRKLINTEDTNEDEYEKLLREVRKMKTEHNNKKATVTKIITKDNVNVKAEQLSFDYQPEVNNKVKEIEKSIIVTQDETINTTMSNREHQKKLQKKVTFMKQALQQEQKFISIPNVMKKNKNIHNLENEGKTKKEEKKTEILRKNDEIVGVIDDEEVEFDSDDEMNFEVEYLDPEFVDC
ncbi:kinesin-related protein 4-like [Leptopilina boulardi]|uniref:kinesin-related protein 4-like n=1 Tax=Leptopilina boulardi TaxID=63433 RepID=UPI0021F5CFFD|nr:kinesin-related protein 4-like [Leptopilina boulardi]